MNFVFSHDGHTYAKHSECPPDQPAQVQIDQVDQDEEPQPLEPSGDAE